MTKILVIDDEPQIQKFLRISLGSQHYDVINAENGRTGITKAVDSRPDLIILDLGLPDLDGKHVFQSIIRQTRAPIMVLSVRDAESEKVTEFLKSPAPCRKSKRSCSTTADSLLMRQHAGYR